MHSHLDTHDVMDGAKNNIKKTNRIYEEGEDEASSADVFLAAHSFKKHKKTSHSPPQPFASVDYYELPLLMPNIHMQP